eukprot:Rmarinus@m.13643
MQGEALPRETARRSTVRGDTAEAEEALVCEYCHVWKPALRLDLPPHKRSMARQRALHHHMRNCDMRFFSPRYTSVAGGLVHDGGTQHGCKPAPIPQRRRRVLDNQVPFTGWPGADLGWSFGSEVGSMFSQGGGSSGG